MKMSYPRYRVIRDHVQLSPPHSSRVRAVDATFRMKDHKQTQWEWNCLRTRKTRTEAVIVWKLRLPLLLSLAAGSWQCLRSRQRQFLFWDASCLPDIIGPGCQINVNPPSRRVTISIERGERRRCLVFISGGRERPKMNPSRRLFVHSSFSRSLPIRVIVRCSPSFLCWTRFVRMSCHTRQG